MTEIMKNTYQSFQYIDTEKIELKTFDSIFSNFNKGNGNIMLKLDTQGSEINIFEGGLDSLSKVTLIQIELSLKQLYENELLLIDMLDYLEKKNFELISIENGMSHPLTHHLLQVDGIFVNKKYSLFR